MEEVNEPDIALAGMSIWIDGYQYPTSTEYWDANWLIVRVLCVGQNATVRLNEACIHAPELAAWLESCVSLNDGRTGEAAMPTMEPYLQVTINRSGEFNGLVAIVKLTPNNISQFHEFRFPIDPSYLPRLIVSLKQTLNRFPVRALNGR